MNFKEKIIKKSVVWVLIFTFIISSTLYGDNYVYAGNKTTTEEVSISEDGNVKLWVDKYPNGADDDSDVGYDIYISGQGQISKEKYKQALNNLMSGALKQNEDSFFRYSQTGHSNHPIRSRLTVKDATGTIYAPEDSSYLFSGLKRVRLGDNFDTSKVTNMKAMFKNCNGATELINTNFNTSSVENMESMFEDANAFNQSLGENFDTSKVTNMKAMFKGSEFNQSLGDKFNTSKVTDMSYMFEDSDFNNEDVQNFDLSSCESIECMFRLGNVGRTSSAIEYLDFSKWDTSKVRIMSLFLNISSGGGNAAPGGLPFPPAPGGMSLPPLPPLISTATKRYEINLGNWELNNAAAFSRPDILGKREELKEAFTIQNIDFNILKCEVTDKDSSPHHNIKVNVKGNYRVLRDDGTSEDVSDTKIPILPNEGMYRIYKIATPILPSDFDTDDYTLQCKKGTTLKDLTTELNDKIPANKKFRLEFFNPKQVLEVGENDVKIEAFPTGADRENYMPSLETIKINVAKKKLENTFFDNSNFGSEIGKKLSSVAIDKTDDNYTFLWKDGDTTTFNTLGENEFTIVATPKDANGDWDTVELKAKVLVKGKIELENIESIVTDDISKLTNGSIKAKAKFAGNDIAGKFEFVNPLGTIDFKNGDNMVDIRFTATPNQANAIENVVNAKVKITYNKKVDSGSDIVIVSRRKEKTSEDDIKSKKEEKQKAVTEQERKAKITKVVNEHFEKSAKIETKNIVDKYIHYKNKANKDGDKKLSKKSDSNNGADTEPKHIVMSTGREIVDVNEDDYYADAVKFAVESGILKGTSEKKFSPNVTMTSGMADTVICRIAGAEEYIKDSLVPITNPKEWYIIAVEWAKISKIIYGDENYDPAAKMRRDDFVEHLYRYSNKLGFVKGEADDSILDKFKDKDVLPSNKKKSMKWAVDNGIIEGTDESKIEPEKKITRGQLALVIERFIEYLSKYTK